jgi:hypothetical protein
MERPGPQSALHRQLMSVIARGAAAQEHSQLLVATHEHLQASVRTSLASSRAGRAEREVARRSQSDR